MTPGHRELPSLWRSLAALTSGSVAAQLVGVAVAPLLTRLYSPSELGAYTLVITGLALFGPAICLRYDAAVIVADEEEVSPLAWLAVMITISISLPVAVGYGIFALSSAYTDAGLVWASVGVWALLTLQGLTNVFNSASNRRRLYGLLASSTFYRVLASNTGFLVLGWAGLASAGLISAQVAGAAFGTGYQGWRLKRTSTDCGFPTRRAMRLVARRYAKQALFNAPSALMATATFSLIIVFVQWEYTTREVGLYALGYRLLGAPFMILSANVARLFFEAAAVRYRARGEFRRLYVRALLILTAVVMPAMALLAALAPFLFRVVFGPEWEQSGVFVAILAPMFCLRLVADSLSTSFIVAKRQGMEVVGYVVLFSSQCATFLLARTENLSIEQVLVLLSALYSVVYFVELIVMFRLSCGRPDSRAEVAGRT